jgi:hypothetical protein
MYDALVTRLTTGGSSNVRAKAANSYGYGGRPDTGPLPWLYYTGSSYLTAQDVTQT